MFFPSLKRSTLDKELHCKKSINNNNIFLNYDSFDVL